MGLDVKMPTSSAVNIIQFCRVIFIKNDAISKPVRVVRSARRRRTISARIVQGELVVFIPDTLSKAEENAWVERMVDRVRLKELSRGLVDDDTLERRARELNRQYFDGKLKWTSIRYVTNQSGRYGSCSPRSGTIRISHKLAEMPRWVLDYVLVHELAHLVRADHSPAFWRLVNRYPLTERARGFLIARGLDGDSGEGDGPFDESGSENVDDQMVNDPSAHDEAD